MPDSAPDASPDLLSGRASGVLLHISCLPSRYGIGDMGQAAYQLADRLQSAGQKYWQILPLNPSSPHAGESPYFSSSAFAGNPLLVDLEALVDEGLIPRVDLSPPRGLPQTEVDFDRVRAFKLGVLERACQAFLAAGELGDFQRFCERHAGWLEDFALFTAIHRAQGGGSWADWPVELRDREPAALASVRESMASVIEQEKVLQYFFFRQWEALKDYCNERGLVIFGDMPIYVSYESADVWSHTGLFKLDETRRPTAVSGVPPDYFSATGQLWNNPVYDWEALRATGYQWWIARMQALFERFDVVRIDHFRGLVQYWEVPAGEDTAQHGSWQDVPTYEFFDTLQAACPGFPVVVEDLGIITDDVVEVKEHYGFPGMLILQFAFFDDGDSNPYLPQNHPQHALVYLGTHDNTTVRGWLEDEIDDAIRWRVFQHVTWDEDVEQQVINAIELLMSSRADIAIVTAQDLLALPGRARINDPSVNLGNWKWRLTQEEFDALPMGRLREMTLRHRRFSGTP
jgi:4-alpha-glucanotransferase